MTKVGGIRDTVGWAGGWGGGWGGGNDITMCVVCGGGFLESTVKHPCGLGEETIQDSIGSGW